VCLDALKKQGATLVDIKIPTFGKFSDSEFLVLLYEFKAGLEKYLSTATTKFKKLKELIEFNEQNAAREMPHFGQEIFIQAENKRTLQEREYRLALQKSKTLTQTQGIDAVMIQQKLDAIVAPTGGPSWLIDLINGDCDSHYVGSSSLAAVAGYPNITVPAGLIDALPIGISFFGRAYTEPKLIKIAYSFEQATNFRQPPKFLKSFS
jgi:Asp-tRNA(Asn)/Glu-tRNA(Gln) amidotransferase A subunit family amidase